MPPQDRKRPAVPAPTSVSQLWVLSAARREGQRFRDAEAAAIASELFGPESNFADATVVNQVLGKLFTLVAQGRIPVSTAALLAQIGQLLIQGLQGPHGE